MPTNYLWRRWLSILCCAALGACVSQGLQVDRRGSDLWLSGRIMEEDGLRVREIIRQSQGLSRVILGDSPGGEEGASLLIGRSVRAAGLETVVAGQCYSGCAAIFLGGVRRGHAWSEVASDVYVGFHGAYLGGIILDMTMNDMRHAYFRQMLGPYYSQPVVNHWLSMELSSDALIVLPPGRALFKNAGNSSIFECRGRGPGRSGSGCAPVIGLDALELGIYTERIPAIVAR